MQYSIEILKLLPVTLAPEYTAYQKSLSSVREMLHWKHQFMHLN